MIDRISQAAAVLLGVLVLATEPSRAPAQQPAAGASEQDLAKELDLLIARFDAAYRAHHAELEALYAGFDGEKATDEQRAALEKKRAELDAKDPSLAAVGEFAALAARARGTEVAAKALLKVFELDKTPSGPGANPGREALDTLLAEHVRSPSLAELPRVLQYAPTLDRRQRNEAYEKLAAGSPIDAVKACSIFALAMDASRETDKTRARAMFVDLDARFGKLVSPFGKTYADHARGFVYEIDHLQLGMRAPDFEATDENGTRFALSDYAGKVVVVDFWGFW